jgi:hypothetical protein
MYLFFYRTVVGNRFRVFSLNVNEFTEVLSNLFKSIHKFVYYHEGRDLNQDQ